MSIFSMFLTDAVLKASRISAGSGGEPIRTLTSTACKARIWEMSADEREVNSREGVVSTHKAFVETTLPVTEKDELWVGSAHYDVTGVILRNTPTGAHHKEVLMKVVA